MSFFLVASDRFADHVAPPGHPERVARAQVMEAVTDKWSRRNIPVAAPRPADLVDLQRVHAPAYLAEIAATAGLARMLDPDTFTSPDTVRTALLAAGGSVVAVDAVLDHRLPTHQEGKAGAPHSDASATSDVPACLVMARPPGHHAQESRAMGFCLLNNVAIAAAHALARGLTRVAVVDYDVHHGNGTERAFYGDPRVLFISTHQFPFYPGTGAADTCGTGDGTGFTVNVPLQAGATDGDYFVAFDQVILPILDAYAPELLLVSAGFDSHMRDPLAQMRMSVRGFNRLARQLGRQARNCGCPIVVVTEGGYHLKVLASALDGLIQLLSGAGDPDAVDVPPSERSTSAGEPDPLDITDLPLVDQPTFAPTGRGRAAVELVRAVQAAYWPGL